METLCALAFAYQCVLLMRKTPIIDGGLRALG